MSKKEKLNLIHRKGYTVTGVKNSNKIIARRGGRTITGTINQVYDELYWLKNIEK